jgi:hypothetical protein
VGIVLDSGCSLSAGSVSDLRSTCDVSFA